MNLTAEGKYKQAIKPTKSGKEYIKMTLKEEFGEDVVYNKIENTIYLCENRHISNPVLIKILSEYKLFLQTSLF